MNINVLGKSKRFGIVALLITMAIAACYPANASQQTTPFPASDEMPGLQNESMVKIDSPTGWNSFKIGDPVVLLIQNVSEEVITFSLDYSAQIYVSQHDSWATVNNKMTYSGPESITLEPSVDFDPAKVGEVYLLPDLSDENSKVTLRIFIQGKGKDSGKDVVASIDVILYPK
jgi:hypothetical protein